MANANVHYSPDDMQNCVPTSGIVCQYCKNRGLCPSVVPRDDIGGSRVSDAELNSILEPTHTHNFSS